MNVLQLVQKPQRRGAEIFAFQLSAALRLRGHEVRTVYLYPYLGERPLQVLTNDVVLEGSEGHPFETLLGHEPGLLRRVNRVIEETKPDVIQLNGARTVKYGALSKRRRSSVDWKLVYRNIDNPAYWATDPLRRWFYRRLVFPEIDGTVGVSRATLKEVLRMYQLDTPTTFIPNGFDPEPLSAAPSFLEARRAVDVPDDVPIMLFMGNLTQQKRPDRFLRVVAGVRDRVPSALGWLLGSGPMEGQLREQARALGIEDAIRFWGYQEDVAPFAVASDVLVVASDSDGIPAVVLEAAFLGKPVVATRVGGLAECIIDGTTGLLVDRQDEEGLIANTATLLTDPEQRAELGAGAHSYVAKTFTIDVIAQRYSEFYEGILAGSI